MYNTGEAAVEDEGERERVTVISNSSDRDEVAVEGCGEGLEEPDLSEYAFCLLLLAI